MDRILDSIESYLDSPPTDYALLLNGDWGSGKTYFIEHELSNMLKRKNLKIAYISLYGVNNTEEIYKRIFFETNKLFGSDFVRKISKYKQVQIFKKLTKFTVDAGMSIKGIDQTRFLFEEILSVNQDIVLCFDDLERVQINIEEMLGFINYFVEHNSIKTIIVANEKEILSTFDYLESETASKDSLNKEHLVKQGFIVSNNKYNHIKEKTIGRTIDLIPNLEQILSNILDHFSNNKDYNKDYNKFLKEHKLVILDLFDGYPKKNIRILKHALNDFQKIFENIDKKMELEDKFKQKLNLILFVPYFIASSELRMGNISIQDLSKIKEGKFNLYSTVHNKQESFFKKYFSEKKQKFNITYYHLPSLYQHIITGYINFELFDQEINKVISDLIAINEDIQNENNELFYLLNNYFDLDDDIFLNYTMKVLTKIEAGKYRLYDYLYAFSFFEYFSEKSLISHTILELLDVFQRGIDNYLLSNPTIESFRPSFETQEEGRSDSYIELHRYITDSVVDYQREADFYEIEEVSKLFYEDFSLFIKKVFSSTGYEDNLLYFLSYLDLDELSTRIVSEKNENINLFANYAYGFYQNKLVWIDFPEDHAAFWTNLNKKMSDLIDLKADIPPLKKLCLEKCIKKINDLLNTLHEYDNSNIF